MKSYIDLQKISNKNVWMSMCKYIHNTQTGVRKLQNLINNKQSKFKL